MGFGTLLLMTYDDTFQNDSVTITYQQDINMLFPTGSHRKIDFISTSLLYKAIKWRLCTVKRKCSWKFEFKSLSLYSSALRYCRCHMFD